MKYAGKLHEKSLNDPAVDKEFIVCFLIKVFYEHIFAYIIN